MTKIQNITMSTYIIRFIVSLGKVFAEAHFFMTSG